MGSVAWLSYKWVKKKKRNTHIHASSQSLWSAQHKHSLNSNHTHCTHKRHLLKDKQPYCNQMLGKIKTKWSVLERVCAQMYGNSHMHNVLSYELACVQNEQKQNNKQTDRSHYDQINSWNKGQYISAHYNINQGFSDCSSITKLNSLFVIVASEWLCILSYG